MPLLERRDLIARARAARSPRPRSRSEPRPCRCRHMRAGLTAETTHIEAGATAAQDDAVGRVAAAGDARLVDGMLLEDARHLARQLVHQLRCSPRTVSAFSSSAARSGRASARTTAHLARKHRLGRPVGWRAHDERLAVGHRQRPAPPRPPSVSRSARRPVRFPPHNQTHLSLSGSVPEIASVRPGPRTRTPHLSAPHWSPRHGQRPRREHRPTVRPSRTGARWRSGRRPSAPGTTADVCTGVTVRPSHWVSVGPLLSRLLAFLPYRPSRAAQSSGPSPSKLRSARRLTTTPVAVSSVAKLDCARRVLTQSKGPGSAGSLTQRSLGRPEARRRPEGGH